MSNLLNKYSAMQILWGNFYFYYILFHFLTLVEGKLFCPYLGKASSYSNSNGIQQFCCYNTFSCLKDVEEDNIINQISYYSFYIFLAHVVLMQPNKNIQISFYLCTFNPLSHLILLFLYRFQ